MASSDKNNSTQNEFPPSSDRFTPLEIDLTYKFYTRVAYSWIGSALFVYTPIHILLKRAKIKRKLYIPFGLGVSFLTASGLSFKFIYDYMNECLSLPPSEYASSAELHFILKRYGFVYIHQNGKIRYAIANKSVQKETNESTTQIDLSNTQDIGQTITENINKNITVEQTPQIKE